MFFSLRGLDEILFELREENRHLAHIGHSLAAIRDILDPKTIGFRVDLIQGNKMPNAAVDFVVFENGQATATLTPVDKDGNATSLGAGASVPAWTSSDPSISVSASADGLSALLTAGQTPVTAATISATATLADGSTISGVSDPIDVVAQPPGAAVAFKIALSA